MKNIVDFKFIFLFVLTFSISTAESFAQEREWRKVNFDQKWNIDASQYQLYRPGRGFYVDDNHNLYVSDIGDNTIKMFDPEGRFLRSFGKRKGAGPGEVRHPVGFDLDGNGNIWIVDPSNSRITVFKSDGSFLKNIPLEILPYRIAVKKNGDYFYTHKLNAFSKGKLTKYSSTGDVLKHYGSNIIENQMRNDIVLSGEIAIGENGSLFYTPDFAGLLMGFSPNGNELFKTQTIVSTPFPEVIFDARGGSRVDRNAKRISRGIFTNENDQVIIFSQAISQNAKQALDFYKADTGKYLYSIKLPEDFHQVYMEENFLYTIKLSNSKVFMTAWEVVSSK